MSTNGTTLFSMASRFRRLLGPQVWRNFVISIALGILWFGVELTFVFVLQGFLSAIGLIPQDKLFLPSWYPRELEWVLITLVLFGLCRAIVHISRSYLMNATHQSFVYNQRTQLLRYGLENPNLSAPNELISVFTEVVSQSGTVIFYIVQLIVSVVSALLFVLYCAKLAPGEILVGVSCLGVLFFPLKIFMSRINRAGRGLSDEWNRTSQTLLNGLKNIFFLRVYGLIGTEIRKGTDSLAKYRDHYKDYAFLSSILGGVPLFFGILLIGLISLLSIHVFKTDSMKLVAFFYLFIRLAQSMSEINQTFSTIRVNWPYFQKLLEFDETLAALPPKRLPASLVCIEDSPALRLEAKELTFGYSTTPLFHDLNFTLKKGDALVIKGPSGSGKSTLLSIIMGQLTPQSGSVLLSGTPIQNVDNLYEHFGYVGPEPYLIWGTVRENLAYGQKSDSFRDADHFRALRQVDLENLVKDMPLGLDQPIFQLNDLSTGQKQRLAIARALLRVPRVLVLDEATANLDATTEARMLGNLKSTLKDAIVLIVTHKDSFDSIATNLIRIGEGPGSASKEESF